MGLNNLYNKGRKVHNKRHNEDNDSMLDFDGHEKNVDESHIDILANEVQKKIDMQSGKVSEQDLAEQDEDANSVEAQVRKTKKEEEKYDQLLNSVQAQNLIKTVDKINLEKSSQKKAVVQNKRGNRFENQNHFMAENDIDDAPKEYKVTDHIDTYVSDTTEDDNFYIDNLSEEDEFVKSTEIYKSIVKQEKQAHNGDDIEKVDVNLFQKSDLKKYVTGQCEVMEEASKHIDEAMIEYSDVTEYFTDIQKIEQAPDHIRKNIIHLAKRVNDLSVDRRISKTNHNRLSTSAYHRMEKYENEIPRGFQYLKKQESYYETVKRDMRILEGEQLNYRLEAKMLTKRQLKIKTFSLVSIIGLVVAFIIFMIALSFVNEDEYIVFYIAVALLGAIIAVGLFALQKYTERQVLLTEIKLNKATNMLNKMKIKYINAANTLDYEYSKYRVKSSYELEKKYQAYVEMKEDQKKVLNMTSILNEAENDLERALKDLSLFDTHIWVGQVKALFNPKEMVEVRHELTEQRQKLRNLIEFNEKKIEEAKRNIKAITLKHPEYTEFAVGIINEYEQKSLNIERK